MPQVAIIITPSDLQKMVAEEVAKQTAQIRAAFEAKRVLPARMSIRDAAKYMGVSESTFHRNHAYLKRYDGGSVYVAGADLVG